MANTPVLPRAITPAPSSGNSSVAGAYDPEETGRSVRPRGLYRAGMFDNVKSSLDFAHALEVPLKAIALIVFKDEDCKSRGCIHKAIEGTGGYCPAHSQRWYPLREEKGGDLHGPEFTKYVNRGRRGCDCSQIGCRSAGYFPGQDAFYIPTEGHTTCFSTPNLFTASQKEKWREMKANKRSSRSTSILGTSCHHIARKEMMAPGSSSSKEETTRNTTIWSATGIPSLLPDTQLVSS